MHFCFVAISQQVAQKHMRRCVVIEGFAMARVFITGSADGLGQLAAKALMAQGHQVVLHARNEKRGQEALDKVPGAESVVTADLGTIDDTKQLASKVNALGKFDAVIHNAGVYRASAEEIFTVNT